MPFHPRPERGSYCPCPLERTTGYILVVGTPPSTREATAELPTRVVPWPRRGAPLAVLVGSFGYTSAGGPIALTIDAQGHVVRIESLRAANDPPPSAP